MDTEHVALESKILHPLLLFEKTLENGDAEDNLHDLHDPVSAE